MWFLLHIVLRFMACWVYRKTRQGGYRLGDGALVDSLVFDGLKDPYHNVHLGAVWLLSCCPLSLAPST